MIFLAVNTGLFFLVVLVLIQWPMPDKVEVENYDFSSIDTLGAKPGVFKEQWVRMRDREDLFTRIYPGDSSTVLILIHGSGSESKYLDKMASTIAQHNRATVITPDLRGHGRNLKRTQDIKYVGQLEEDSEDLIKFAKSHLKAKEIILAGHSSGGGLVLRYVANPELSAVHKAIMIAPYLGHESPTVKENSGDWVRVAVKRWVGIEMLNRVGIKVFNDLPVLLFNRPVKYEDPLQVDSYSYRMAVNFAPKDYVKDIANLQTKSLVVVGEEDESFYAQQFDTVFQPAKKYTTVQRKLGVNHLNIVRNKEVIQTIIEFMEH